MTIPTTRLELFQVVNEVKFCLDVEQSTIRTKTAVDQEQRSPVVEMMAFYYKVDV